MMTVTIVAENTEHTYTMNQGTLTHIDHRHAVGSYY